MVRHPLKIFLSHTAELREFPTGRTFIQAAERGIVRSGNAVTDMEYFTSQAQRPADYCREQVAKADVYVGVLGFRYGSRVQDEPDLSYTELEFEAAAARGTPRLVFMLDENASVPMRYADVDRSRQARFRAGAAADALTVAAFKTADELELLVFQALTDLTAPDRDDAPGTPWMTPASWGEVVPRPELSERLTSMLLRPGGGQVAVTTGLHGVGGFGKTTLAAQVCRSDALKERFADGLLWVTIGERLGDTALAEKINDLSEVVSGRRPTLSDPDQAGHRLGQLLRDRRCLLVVDDVWTKNQLVPFLHGAPECTRLITTRNRGVLPMGGAEIEVDAMEIDEARAVLSLGLTGLGDAQLNSLLGMTGRWPVLLTLVNSAMRRLVRRGATVAAAAERIAQRLLAGPTALDVRRPLQRDAAVATTVEASFGMLTAEQLDRYLGLAIFPEDTDVPVQALETWWAEHGMDEAAVAQLCDEFADLSLLHSHGPHPDSVRLHDVIRSYLRSRCGADRLAELNDSFLRAVESSIPGDRAEAGTAWWRLPEEHYLWRHLAYHLVEAGRDAELQELLGDLRWACAKLERLGPVEVEVDLALADGFQPRELRREIGRSAHLLEPTEPRRSLRDILLSRLHGITALEPMVKAYEGGHGKPLMRSLRRLPDWPHPAQRRILSAPVGRVLACAADPAGEVVIGGGEDRTLWVWDVDTGQIIQTLRGHTGPVWTCAISPDGSWVASGGDDGTLRLWDTATGRNMRTLTHDGGAIRACVIDPAGEWVASAGDDRQIRIRSRATGAVTQVFAGYDDIVRSLVVSPDGSWLAGAGDDLTIQIFDLGTGERRHVLTGHTDSVWALTTDPGGEWLASGGLDRTVRIWSPRTGDHLRTLETPSGPVLAHGRTPQGSWLATGGDEGSIQVWDLGSGALRGVLEGHSGRVRACAADPDGRWLATAGDDHSIRTWDMHAVDGEQRRDTVTGPTWGCSADRHRGTVVTAGADRVVRLWEGTGSPRELGGVPMHPWAVAISPAGDRAAVATQDGRVWSWDVRTSVRHRPHAVHDGAVWDCAFTADGRFLLTVGEDGKVCLNDMDRHLPIMEERVQAGPLRCCALAPDDGWYAVAGEGGVVTLADLGRRRTLRAWQAAAGMIWTCAVPPDGGTLVTGAEDGTIALWDPPTGELIRSLTGHRRRVRQCSVSPDGDLLASASADRTLRVWRLSDGSCLASMRVNMPFSGCSWLPGGNVLYATGDGGTYTFELTLPQGP